MDQTSSDFDDRVYTENAVEWQRRRAGRRSLQETENRLDYALIVFPPVEGCRHAALVVCGAMADQPDPVTASREILEALALPTILREGGDGRALRTQNRSSKRRGEPLPIGYGEDDYGRPDAKETRKRKKQADATVPSV
jgi:hypothetical protein